MTRGRQRTTPANLLLNSWRWWIAVEFFALSCTQVQISNSLTTSLNPARYRDGCCGSRVQHCLGGYDVRSRTDWALALAAKQQQDDADVVLREQMEESKKAAKLEQNAPQLRALQQLLPGLDAALLVSKSPRLLYCDMQLTIPGRLATMKDLLPGVDVQRLVRLHPDLLLYEEKTLAPRIIALKEFFRDSPKLLMRAPDLLYHDLNTFILPKMEELRELLPGLNVSRIIRREPTILSLDVQGNVKQRLQALAKLFPAEDISTMISKAPRLLTCDVSGMEQKVSSLRWLLGPTADLNKIIHRRPEILLSKVETTLATKFRQLQDLFPDSDVVTMIEKDATVLLYDFETGVNVKVECWRERVSNVTDLDFLIQGYPVILSYSLDMSVSRLDFLLQTNATEMYATRLRKVVQMPRRDWENEHGDHYRRFLEQKGEGPKALRLWPGLYFDSDADNSVQDRNDKEGRAQVTLQGDGTVMNPRVAKVAEKVHVQALEKKYGTSVKEAHLRFSSVMSKGKYGAAPSELDMVLYDIKTFDKQVRKLATRQRLKRFSELLPGLNTERLFTDFPNVLMMDLKKVEERVAELRELLAGGDLSGAVSIAPQLLLNDVQTCLRPRMTRLVVALSVNQLEGVLDADKVRSMIVRCPQLLLNDVRNVVVPSLQFMLSCTKDHEELGRRLFRDPSLLVVGTAPLARLQYTLEQYRNGTSLIPIGSTGYLLHATTPRRQPRQPATVSRSSGAAVGDASLIENAGFGSDANSVIGGKGPRRGNCENAEELVPVREGWQAVGEDQSRLLPPVVIPQVLKCQLRDFVQRNPRYLSFLARRQGLVDRLAVRQIEAWHGQVVFWERAVGARLSETYRPVDSPYAQEKLKEKLDARGGRAPAGQKEVGLNELDLLVGDVLYFNSRMGVLFRDKLQQMPQLVDLGEEVNKLADDVEWGSRQISRLLRISSWTGIDSPVAPSTSTMESAQASSAVTAASEISAAPRQGGGVLSSAVGGSIDADMMKSPAVATAPVSKRKSGKRARSSSSNKEKLSTASATEPTVLSNDRREPDQSKAGSWVADIFRNLLTLGNGGDSSNGEDDSSNSRTAIPGGAGSNATLKPSKKTRKSSAGVSRSRKAGVVEEGRGVTGEVGGSFGDRETALELERLLGEVSSFEGRLEGLLGMQNVTMKQMAEDEPAGGRLGDEVVHDAPTLSAEPSEDLEENFGNLFVAGDDAVTGQKMEKKRTVSSKR